MFFRLSHLAVALCLLRSNAFTTPNIKHTSSVTGGKLNSKQPFSLAPLNANNEPANKDSGLTAAENEKLAQTFGGYTVKQRLREEVESPFRKVRLLFFASSAGSALTALYFSALSVLKAYMGGFSDTPPLNESLTSCAINIAGAVGCGLLAYRDYQGGQVNLERIAKGGKLAKLAVSPADVNMEKSVRTLSDYRRNSRVLICAGGKEYIEQMCKSLNADQMSDENNLPKLLEEVDVLTVPVLLTNSDGRSVGDVKTVWRETSVDPDDANNRNFDSTRSDNVVAFPWNNAAWADYLKSEIETAKKQGFDVVSKGITITVKKNGKILRRATGSPRWGDLVGTMEVLDGSRFGMPGDSEKYGGH
mmetsp:Transcript_2583/g.3877  ORF Transcript_2583/g.3877 Transcript_2583/m.3877 type:complete len:361 (-) Transcript_2583:84-1166(-)